MVESQSQEKGKRTGLIDNCEQVVKHHSQRVEVMLLVQHRQQLIVHAAACRLRDLLVAAKFAAAFVAMHVPSAIHVVHAVELAQHRCCKVPRTIAATVSPQDAHRG
eukprot:3243439-Pleurochrysis_carterae.AAC.1